MSIYYAKCVMCHGANLEGVKWDPMKFSPFMGTRLGGGNGLPAYKAPPDRITTLAYSAPWATVIFNTIAVEMPFLHPGTLKVDEVYSLTALVLFKNGLIKEDDVMDRTTLPKVQMPNRNAYPASDEIYMDMKKRGCIEKYGICRDP
jgi:cytochrome c